MPRQDRNILQLPSTTADLCQFPRSGRREADELVCGAASNVSPIARDGQIRTLLGSLQMTQLAPLLIPVAEGHDNDHRDADQRDDEEVAAPRQPALLPTRRNRVRRLLSVFHDGTRGG